MTASVLGGFSPRQMHLSYRLRSFLSTSNYKTASSTLRAFDVGTAWARVEANAGTNHGVQLSYTRQRSAAVLYPYLQMDAGSDDADRARAGYDWRGSAGPVQGARVTGYATSVRHWMTDENRVSSQGMARAYSMATLARTATQGMKAEATVKGGTIGVDAYRRQWNAETQLAMVKYQAQYSIPDVSVLSVGLFAEFTRHVGDRLTVDFGGRLDHTSNAADAAKANTALYLAYLGRQQTSASDTYPSGKVRVSYQAHPSLTLTAGVGHTVRVPDPQERYFGLRRMGSDWVGNPFLEPTANTGIEVGAAWRAGRLFVSANLYRDALANAIGVYQQARVQAVAGITNLAARTYRNVDATMTGGEVEAVLSITDRLSLSADYSAVQGRQHTDAALGIKSPWLAETPPARSRATLRYETKTSRLAKFAEIETIYSAAQTHVDSDLMESPTPAYSVTNVRIGGSLWHLRGAVGVGNVFNRTYVEHLSYQRDPFRLGNRVYEPGRNVYANLALQF